MAGIVQRFIGVALCNLSFISVYDIYIVKKHFSSYRISK